MGCGEVGEGGKQAWEAELGSAVPSSEKAKPLHMSRKEGQDLYS